MVEQERLSSIAEDNAYFKNMLDLIPPHLYFDKVAKEQIREKKQEELAEPQTESGPKVKKKKSKKQKNKEFNKGDNPFQTKSVTQLQEELFNENTSKNYTEIKNKKFKSNPVAAVPNSIPVASGSADIDDRRAKLRAKIEELQAKRKLNDHDRLQKKKLKRQESKMKMRQKRREQKTVVNKGNAPTTPSKSHNSAQNINKTPTKPVFNKDGQMVFSKFDFTDSSKKEKKEKKSDLTGKDYKRLLEKVERRNEKIKKVKNKDESAGKSLQNKYRWDSALLKAEGQKVKDNPDILKKALKRKEKIKDKRKQKWQERSDHTETMKDAKQTKRNKNLQQRKQAVKDRKIKKLKKKGRLIPGF